jgi:flagellar biogenesis protein FliO
MMKKFLLVLLVFCCSYSLYAKEKQGNTIKEGILTDWVSQQEHPDIILDNDEHKEPEKDSFEAKFMNMLVVLGLLIGFMILASWALKKMMRTRVQQMNISSDIKLVETRHLSPRCTLYLVEIQGSSLLIAESPSTVSHIATFEITDS